MIRREFLHVLGGIGAASPFWPLTGAAMPGHPSPAQSRLWTLAATLRITLNSARLQQQNVSFTLCATAESSPSVWIIIVGGPRPNTALRCWWASMLLTTRATHCPWLAARGAAYRCFRRFQIWLAKGHTSQRGNRCFSTNVRNGIETRSLGSGTTGVRNVFPKTAIGTHAICTCRSWSSGIADFRVGRIAFSLLTTGLLPVSATKTSAPNGRY